MKIDFTKEVERICKENELIGIMRKIDAKWGGDDPIWLQEYMDEVIATWSHDLDKAISQFRQLLGQDVHNGKA